jgi:lipopolysaccharide/colanic/teichoic acid biosynthesis glycosyltransferase
MPRRPFEFEGGNGGILQEVEGRIVFHQRLYVRYCKRALDVLCSAVGIAALSPVFLLAACCVKLSSRGPAFYRQTRIGKDGRQFQILKFRSMVVEAEKRGLAITVSGDRRVTAVGKLLRRYKVDELPQLWNVLCGEMSLVGPRPELPIYVAAYTPEQRRVLSVRPGITDPATLAYRNEEEILADRDDPEQFYRAQVLPDKLERNLAYLQRISFGGDLRILFETVASSFLPSRKTQGKNYSD